MTDNLFNPEAFEQMPGQMSMADVASNPKTWDGEPMFSPESVRETAECLGYLARDDGPCKNCTCIWVRS